MTNNEIKVGYPLRISFVGGGTDVEPFLSKFGGSVIASTINWFVTTRVMPNESRGIRIRSVDLGWDILHEPHSSDDLLISNLISSCITCLPIENRTGFQIEVNSPVPPKSGLGTSSAMVLSIVDALHKYFKLDLPIANLVTTAFKIEREVMGIPGGCQDQYVCAHAKFAQYNFLNYETFNFQNLNPNESFIEDLETRSLLVWTGIERNSKSPIEDQIARSNKGSNTEGLQKQKELVLRLNNAIGSQNIGDFASILNEAWKLKKTFSKYISNHEIDALLNFSLSNGALAGKLLGAGGGGFVYLLTDNRNNIELQNQLKSKGYRVSKFKFFNND